MSCSRTFYLRSSPRNVLQLEINTHDKAEQTASSSLVDWLQDKHVQEVLELLRDQVVAYDASQSGRRGHSSKQSQLPSDIITGSTLRLGYVFKNRPSNQLCLIPSKVMSIDGNYEDDELIDLRLLPEKLVVYVHLLTSRSPQKMSQLVKAIGDRRHSAGVSVSSYFKKLPSSQTGSNSQTENAATETQTSSNGSVSQSTTASEDSRNKIKNILERGNLTKSKGRNARQLKVRTKGPSDTTNSQNKVMTDFSSQESVPTKTSSKLTSNNSPPADDKPCAFEAVTITKVGKLSDILSSSEENSSETSSTFVSVKREEEEERSASQTIGNKQHTACKAVNNGLIDGRDTHIKHEVAHDKLLEDGHENTGHNVMLEDGDKHLVLEDKDKHPSRAAANEELHEDQDKDPNFVTDTSDDDSLPSASFCIQPPKTKTQEIDELSMPCQKSPDGIQTSDSSGSTLFKGKTTEHFEKSNMNRADACYLTSQDICSDDMKSISDSGVKSEAAQGAEKKDDIPVPVKRTARRRLKRKLPNFSDTDSDDNVNKKCAREPLKERFVNLSKLKLTSKRLSISKSFFSDAGEKAQPTLSHFMSAANKENGNNKDDENTEDADDLDLELIKELSDKPKVKSEADIELRREISSLSSVIDLNDEQLRYLVNYNRLYLRNIFAGKIKCQRHEMYKSGGQSKRNLNFKSCLSQFTEEQVDIVMDVLVSIFCKRHHKYLDYVMKVLLPEMLIRLHMDVHGTSHEESERQLTP